jgi:hypothetical protein
MGIARVYAGVIEMLGCRLLWHDHCATFEAIDELVEALTSNTQSTTRAVAGS